MDVRGVVDTIMKPDPTAGGQVKRRAIVAGAVGRRGETLLNVVLAHGGYQEVIALTERTMSLGVKHLSTSTLDALPQAQDLFILLSDARDPETRSFHGRDAAFVLADESNCWLIPQKAAGCGVQRIVLIAPAPIWLQFGELSRGAGSELERHLHELQLKRLVILRPMKQMVAAGGGLSQRIINMYLSIQMLMTPRTMPVMTSDQLARLSLFALNRRESGVEVFGASDLGQLLEQSKQPATESTDK